MNKWGRREKKKKKKGGGRNNILRFNPPVQKKGRIRNFKMETL